jgi:hypothetical protein
MRACRRHRSTPGAVLVGPALLALLPLMGSTCIGGDPSGERRACEEVCAAEAACDLGRSEAACLAALCDENGFKIVLEAEDTPDAGPAGESDLQDLVANDCMRAATDCEELVLCSCPDACARVDECTGSADAACTNTCESLLEQDLTLYLENRCKMESSCADLAACGSVSG